MEPGHVFPSLQKSEAGKGSIKDGSGGSFELQLQKETDASRPLPTWETAVDPHRAEDWLELLEPPADQGTEELLGLPLAENPDKPEDPNGYMYPARGGEEVPKAADPNLAALLLETPSACCGWIPC